MSQRDVECLLGRLVTDSRVRLSFFEAPEDTVAREPYNVSAQEVAALLKLGEANLAALAATIDGSIMRATMSSADDMRNLLSSRAKP